MKIAITGASGHIGSNLCPELSKHNHQLRLLKFQHPVIPVEGAEIIEGDITNRRTLDDLVHGVDVVIHLAARISISDREKELLFKVNDQGTRNVVDACLDHGVKRLVHFSTIHAYNPYPLDEVLDETRELVSSSYGSDYDLSKVAGERYVMEAVEKGLEVVVLTPTSVFGPNDHKPSLLGSAILDIYNGKVPTLVPGGYDFVSTMDVVKGIIAAIEKGRNGEKYLLSGNYLTIKKLAQKIGDIGGVKVTQTVLSSGLLRLLMPIFQMQSQLANKPPIFTRESLKALLESNPFISSEKAARELGYSKTPVDVALKKTLDWFNYKGWLKERS